LHPFSESSVTLIVYFYCLDTGTAEPSGYM